MFTEASNWHNSTAKIQREFFKVSKSSCVWEWSFGKDAGFQRRWTTTTWMRNHYLTVSKSCGLSIIGWSRLCFWWMSDHMSHVAPCSVTELVSSLFGLWPVKGALWNFIVNRVMFTFSVSQQNALSLSLRPDRHGKCTSFRIKHYKTNIKHCLHS